MERINRTIKYPKISVLAAKLRLPALKRLILETSFDHSLFHSKYGTQEKNFFVSGPILIRFGVQMYLGDILAHTKSYQDWLRIGCAGQISILLHKLLWCSISLLWKNDIFWHLDWFFEIFGNELQIFLHGWLEGLQGFHLERVWLHENFYFLVRKCLDFRGKNLKNNSSPFFSNMVRARAFNLSRPLIDTIKPYNFYC